MDDNSVSHGTHVSGIAAAIMDNSKGIAGISQSKLLAVKVCNFMGMCTWPSIEDGIYYAANNSAKVISMSINKDDYSSAAEDAANYAYNTKGALLVACSGEAYIGNGTEFIAYPGNFSNVTAVGATDSNDQLAYFSNYGAKLELVAPGVDIYSTIRNNGYGYESGCSMSVPHVSGVAALIWSQYPALSNNEVRQILTGTADDLGSPGRDIYYGYGKVDAYSAVSYLPGWDYRKQKNITGTTAGVQTNYQMNLTFYKGSGTDSPGIVYLGGNVRDDFGDLRFTKSDGVTLLDYWIESYTSGVSATVLVEIDSIPASPGTTNIYIYYGNPAASSASNPDATFGFHDGFSGSSLDTGKWNNNVGSASVSGGALDLINAALVVSKTGFSYPGRMVYRAKFVSDLGFIGMVDSPSFSSTTLHSSPNSMDIYSHTYGIYFGSRKSNAYSEVNLGTGYIDYGNYHIWEFIWTGTTIQLLRDSTVLYTKSDNIPIVTQYPALSSYRPSPQSRMMVDYTYVRKYASPEPTWG